MDHNAVDPIEHPILAFAVQGLAGWIGAALAISLTADLFAGLLSSVVGGPPTWVGTVSFFALLVTTVRGLGASFAYQQIPIGLQGQTTSFGPLSAVQARVWWAVLWIAVALGHWAGDISFAQWFICPMLFTAGTESGWHRERARMRLRGLRGELREAVREHLRLQRLVPRHLATFEELKQAEAEVARLNLNLGAAAEAWRYARPLAGAVRERW